MSVAQANQGLRKSKLVNCNLGQVVLLAHWTRDLESHSLTKSLTKMSKKWPQAIKMESLACPKEKLERKFF